MLQPLDGVFYRRLAVTAAVLAAYRLGAHLPLPGLDMDATALLFRPGDSALERVSILALGIGPLFSVLILTEMARTLFPSLRRWELASPGNGSRVGGAVILIALAFTLIQGIGYAGALEGVTNLVEQAGIAFRLSTAITLTAATAVIVLMARVIDRHGLGHGIWLLFLIPILATVPERVMAMYELVTNNSYPLWAFWFGLAAGIASVAAVVTLLRARPGWPQVGPACLWPMLMAYTVLPWILILIGFLTTGDVNQAVQVTGAGSAARIGVLALLIAGAVFLYARSVRMSGTPFPAGLTAPIALVLALIGIADDLLPYWLGVLLPLGGLQLVVATVVATSMLIEWKIVGAGDKAADDAAPLSPPA